MTNEEAEALKPFAISVNQRNILELIASGQATSPTQAGTKMGMDQSHARRAIRAVRKRAAAQGVAPEQGMNGESVPEGFQLDKSTVHVKDGSVVQRWDRVSAEKEAMRIANLEALQSVCESLPVLETIPAPEKASKDLMVLYTLADLHFGGRSWRRETGDDYNLKIAVRQLKEAFTEMVENSPAADFGVLNLLGDLQHFCGMLAVTVASGNVLDADGRYQKVCEEVYEVVIWAVGIMAQRHKKVRVIVEEGNHDENSTPMLRVSLKHIFSANPRVEVDQSPKPYHAFLFGDNMICTSHGHLRKMKDLGAYFSAEPEFREMWGKAKRTYAHTAHFHNERVLTLPGIIIEQHPTLTGRSSYEARHGWQSMRAAKAITYHKKRGEVSRVTVVPKD